jgi:hypothetical protein
MKLGGASSGLHQAGSVRPLGFAYSEAQLPLHAEIISAEEEAAAFGRVHLATRRAEEIVKGTKGSKEPAEGGNHRWQCVLLKGEKNRKGEETRQKRAGSGQELDRGARLSRGDRAGAACADRGREDPQVNWSGGTENPSLHHVDSGGSQTGKQTSAEALRGPEEGDARAQEDGACLAGLAQVCLEEGERIWTPAAECNSDASASDVSMSAASGSADPKPGGGFERCDEHAKSMRWRGGGDDESDVSGREDDVSSGGSSRKRGRNGNWSRGTLDELSSESPAKRSRGPPNRSKGGRGGEEKMSDDSTVQSGQKRKQADSASSESVWHAERRPEEGAKQGRGGTQSGKVAGFLLV